MKRYVAFLSVALLLLSIMGCRSLTLSISDTNPPVFSFSAGQFAECCRHLTFLVVYEVPDGKSPKSAARANESIVIWEIWPNAGTDNSAERIPQITYGKVPPGFLQKVPADGVPPALVEGKIYEVGGGPRIEVPDAYLRFRIQNGKAVQLPL